MLWYRFLIDVVRTSAFNTAVKYMLYFMVYVFAVIAFQRYVYDIDFFVPYFAMYMMGYVIIILFYFRLNNSYYRWYEGKKYLTYLTSNSETFLIKILSYLLKSDTENRIYFYQMIDNHLKACNNHLRGNPNTESLIEVYPGFRKSIKEKSHLPNAIMSQIEKKVVELYKNQYITRVEYLEISKHIDKSNTYLDNCDTIRTTKTTKSYVNHIRMFLLIYSLFLPFAFSDRIIEFWMVMALGIIFYAYSGCEAMSEEVENPFGFDKNDIPLESIYNDTQLILNQVTNTPK